MLPSALDSLFVRAIHDSGDISIILRKLLGCARYSLQDLSLSYNQITDTFPYFSMFPSLIVIDLSNTLFLPYLVGYDQNIDTKRNYMQFIFILIGCVHQ